MRAFVFSATAFQLDLSGDAPVPAGAKVVEVENGIPLRDLVWNGKTLVDRKTVTTWWMDGHGNSYAYQGDPSWTVYVGSYDAPRTREQNGIVRLVGADEALASEINEYARQLIYSKVSDNAQKNLTAYSTSLVKDVVILGKTLSDSQKADLETSQAIFDWINGQNGVTSAARALVAAKNKDYRTSSLWPAWKSEWTTFLARF